MNIHGEVAAIYACARADVDAVKETTGFVRRRDGRIAFLDHMGRILWHPEKSTIYPLTLTRLPIALSLLKINLARNWFVDEDQD